jgi:hypothetical protein
MMGDVFISCIFLSLQRSVQYREPVVAAVGGTACGHSRPASGASRRSGLFPEASYNNGRGWACVAATCAMCVHSFSLVPRGGGARV